MYTKIDDRGWRSKPNTFSIFLYLLTNANTEEKQYHWHTIKRGDCIIWRKALSKTLGMTENQVRTSLEQLKSTNEITIKTTSKFSVITVCKWEEYQEHKKKPPTEPPAKTPTNHQQTTTPLDIYNYIDKNIRDSVPDYLLENFNSFLGMRATVKKKPATPHAQKILLDKLLKIWKTEYDQNKILEKSIVGNRLGIFPLKEEDMLHDMSVFRKRYDMGKHDDLKRILWVTKFFEMKKLLLAMQK